MSQTFPTFTILALGFSAIFFRGCGGGSTSSPPPPPPPPAAAMPAIWPVSGSYSPTQMVTLSDTTAGAVFYYTTDGTTPTSSSTRYSGPIPIAVTTTLKAIAMAPGFSPSSVVSSTYTIVSQTGSGPSVSILLTTNDQTHLLSPQTSINFGTQTSLGWTIVVDENQTYQTMEGFGASFTDTACYLLAEVAPAAARTSTMSDLFTRNGNGIGLSFMRNPIGGSDLARTHYSFDDVAAGQTDPNLTGFSIAHDQADIIPLILRARQLNPQMKIMATPWSPPGWMKSTGSMIGGTLLPSAYTPYANYFVKYLQAYAAAGINIDYVSLQNEPLFVPSDYPGMSMDAPTQASVLHNNMLPAFAAANIKAKVLVYDHNYDRPDYPETVFSDTLLASSSQIAGTAWHGYGGPIGSMTTLNNLFPNLGNYETELSGGTWVSNQLKEDFENITQATRNYARSYVKWSLAVDQNHGPHDGGCGTCSGIVTVDSTSGAISYTVEYYTLGHFSRFVLPGATRIFSSNTDGIVSAAFRNPDNSKALVAFNEASTAQSFTVQWGSQAFTYTLPSLTGATFLWNGTQAAGYSIPATSQIQASSYSTVSGLQSEQSSDSNGGYDLAYSSNGSYAVYKNVDFAAGVTQVSARLACDPSQGGNCGGTLEFHLDSFGGPLAGSVVIPATGGWQKWSTVSGSASNASGLHTLYVAFKGSTNTGNVNWLQFH